MSWEVRIGSSGEDTADLEAEGDSMVFYQGKDSDLG